MVEGLIPFVFRVIKRGHRARRSRNYHRLSVPVSRTASCCFPLLQERLLEQNESLPDRLAAGIVSPASDCSEKMFKSPRATAASNGKKSHYPREMGRSVGTVTYQVVV